MSRAVASTLEASSRGIVLEAEFLVLDSLSFSLFVHDIYPFPPLGFLHFPFVSFVNQFQ